MKARSLIPCILLSTLIVLLFSMAAQATEYREVKAEDILAQIENCEDVNYNNCQIVGELNVSNIKLKTVPNPRLYKLMNEQYDKKVFNNSGLSENLLVIESNITITNSIFKNGSNFSNVLFNNFTNFSGATFNSSANFYSATFNSSADFSLATFSNSANFYSAIFNDSVDFWQATFNDSVDFWQTTFNDSVDFVEVTFNDSATFSQATFNSSAKFSLATFNGYADFREATFDGSAIFWRTRFNGYADFEKATFNDPVEFWLTTFNGYADFEKATFNSFATFSQATFNSSAKFSLATFNDSVDFWRVTFSSPTLFWQTTFNNSANFLVPDTPENIITDGKTCEFFRKSYNNEALYTDADTIYYNYRKYSQGNKDLTSLSKWTDILSWITCGYGLKPSRTLLVGGIIVEFFSIIYWKGSGIYKSSGKAGKRSTVSGLDALLFSIREFTTVGSGDWYPRDNFKIWVTLEGLLGWVMLGIFMATLTNVMIRS